MAGVVVWVFKTNRNLWTVYEPAVSCELERLYLLGSQQNVSLGSISRSLSCYEVSFVHMTQTNIPSGSVREVRRVICSHTSPLGQGVVWEFEGDTPNQWTMYDLDTMNQIEDGFLRHGQMNISVLDLQQTHVHLPYVIDFARMTQMRVETGRIRRIQRRSLGQTFSPLGTFAAGLSTLSSALLSSSSSSSSSSGFASSFGTFAAGLSTLSSALLSSSSSSSSSSGFASSFGHSNWQSSQPTFKSQATKSKSRQHPYTHSPAMTSIVNGALNGSAAAGSLSSQISPQTLQQQQLQLTQSSHNPGPLTRRRHHRATSTAASVPQPHSHMQHPQMQPHPPMPQMYPSTQQPYYHQSVPPLHIPGSYQQLFGHLPGPVSGFQLPSSGPLSTTSLGFIPPLAHQQMSRPASNSSLSSSSSTSSSMSVSVSQGTESLPGVFKVTISKSKKAKGKTGVDMLTKYVCSVDTDLEKNDCSICCEKLSEASSYGEGKADAHAVVELNKCRHQFHKLCLLEMYMSVHKTGGLQCPSCKTIYGEKTGNCPPGYMQWRLIQDLTLPGYEGCGAILISYHISPGIQMYWCHLSSGVNSAGRDSDHVARATHGLYSSAQALCCGESSDHPNPGHGFTARGFPRQGYLPDCDKGRKVLKLLMEAFQRRLMFTIATSNTTGEANTVTWNEIHHKTEPYGNNSGHGYPDPQYLDNVLMELAAHGVTEDCLR